MQTPIFLQNSLNRLLETRHENPQQSYYLYDLESLQANATLISSLQDEQLTVRYAMKANHNDKVLNIIRDAGISIDACSEFEAQHAIRCGRAGHQIQVSSQQSPRNWATLQEEGIQLVCTSLGQVQDFCNNTTSGNIAIRINPGQGSGQFQQINTGGTQSPFGIWYEYIDKVKSIANQHSRKITKLHIHIGSGSDTQVWLTTLDYCLEMLEKFPDVTILNMGGGFKVGRMEGEKTTDLPSILNQAKEILKNFQQKSGRHIHLEIEPGSYFTVNYGYIITIADDIVDTGKNGNRFVRTTTGMDMLLRPALYHAQHPFYHYSMSDQTRSETGDHHYSFVGHCCETTDLLTPSKDGGIGTRAFSQEIQRGDLIIIGGCGAYCESMRCIGYNGF